MTATTPLRCANSAMTQRGTNEVVLLNSGNYPSESNLLNETCTWNGTNWTIVTGTTQVNAKPLPTRINQAMGYDGTNVMMFGGQTGSSLGGYLEDTWVWNGTVWTQIVYGAATVIPSGRWNSGTSNHSSTQVVMFGGQNTLVNLNDTWIWTGSTQIWNQVTTPNTTAGTPAARAQHMMQGSAAGVTLLFGGQGTNSQFNDTWTFNGSVWTQLTPAASPSIRSDASIAYDSVNNIWVMFGGHNEYNFLPETWIYTAGATNNWQQVSIGAGPSGRIGAQMNFDTQSGKTLMFGGITATSFYPVAETWSFSGSTKVWTQL